MLRCKYHIKDVLYIRSNFENTHIVITIFGIRIKIKKKKTFELRTEKLLTKLWSMQYDNTFNAFLQQYILVNKDFMSPQISLIAISTLIENKSYAQAELLLNKHIKKYGMSDIPKFLLVSAFCQNINITNAEITKSVKIYEHIKNNQENFLLEKTIQNKSIAIVGNSPCAVGLNEGAEIDKSDIVIKFNNFSNSEKYQNDYGSRNDIWMIAGNITKKNYDKHFETLQMIIIADDIEHCIFLDDFRKFLYEIIANTQIPISSLNFEYRKFLRNKYNLIHPSTGFQIISYISDNRNIVKNFRLYGFSFNDSKDGVKNNMFNKYFQKRPPFYIIHNYYKECEILSELLKENKELK